MGRLKELRKKAGAWRTEEMDGSRESLASAGESWLASRPAWQRRVLLSAAGVLVAAALVATVAFAVTTVAESGQGGYEDASAAAAAEGEEGGGESAATASKYADCFYELENWPFLSRAETIAAVEDSIYTKLLESGLEEGSFVHLQKDPEETDKGYRGWLSDDPRGKYWKAEVDASDWSVELTEVGFDDTPSGKEAAKAEEEEKAYLESLAKEKESSSSGSTDSSDESTEKDKSSSQSSPDSSNAKSKEKSSSSSSENTASTASAADSITKENGVALSDTKSLKELMPEKAARTAAETLCAGAKSEYGFSASASRSYVLRSSVKSTSSGCTFRVKMGGSSGSALVLDVVYDSSTSKFTGTEVK